MAGKKGKGKKRGRTPNQEAAAKKKGRPAGASTKHVNIAVAIEGTTKKGKKSGKIAAYEAKGTRVANGKKRGKRKNNGKKRGKRKNNGGLRVHNVNMAEIKALLKDDLSSLPAALPAILAGGAAWATPGLIYTLIPKETRDNWAKSMGDGQMGHDRMKAAISGAVLIAAWLGTNKVEFLKKQRLPIVFGSAIRFIFDLAGAMLGKEGIQGNARAWMGLPDGNYDLQVAATTKGNWVQMTPQGVGGNFQQFTPSLGGWANMQLLPHGMTMQGMHSGIRSQHSQGGYGGVGAPYSVHGGSF